MKRKMIFGISCVAVAIAGLIYVNKSNSVKLVENDLLMENVEALTQNDYPQGPPLTNWKKYDVICPEKMITTTIFVELSAGAVIPVGAVPVYVNGKLGYNKTVTKTYKPVVEKCGQGAGSCFISKNCD